jgi:hypothetical protein
MPRALSLNVLYPKLWSLSLNAFEAVRETIPNFPNDRLGVWTMRSRAASATPRDCEAKDPSLKRCALARLFPPPALQGQSLAQAATATGR